MCMCAWCPDCIPFMVYSSRMSSFPKIGFGSNVTLTKINNLLKINEWGKKRNESSVPKFILCKPTVNKGMLQMFS